MAQRRVFHFDVESASRTGARRRRSRFQDDGMLMWDRSEARCRNLGTNPPTAWRHYFRVAEIVHNRQRAPTMALHGSQYGVIGARAGTSTYPSAVRNARKYSLAPYSPVSA
ncbi:MAG: hypothetical protein ACR2JB_21590 [Bryobacteraceae bacterium]